MLPLLFTAASAAASNCTTEDGRLWASISVEGIIKFGKECHKECGDDRVCATQCYRMKIPHSEECMQCMADAQVCLHRYLYECSNLEEDCNPSTCLSAFKGCSGLPIPSAEDRKTLTALLLDGVEHLLKPHHKAPLVGKVNLIQDKPAPPVVFMHGMGDSGSNPGMKSLCDTVSDAYRGTYVACLDVADALQGITTVLDKQLEEFRDAIRADEKLKHGFNAVGISQGNLVIRAYIERYNDPPVLNYVSMVGPQNGVGTCPDNPLYKLVCPIWEWNPYGAPLAFSDYWKNSLNEAEYLEKSRFLADINNEKPAKNAKYRDNMKSLRNYVLVKAANDTMVIPGETEHHGFWSWGKGEGSKPEKLEDTKAFQEDWLGLKTLKEAGKLHLMTYEGDHMQWGAQFWEEQVLPFLKPLSDSEEKELFLKYHHLYKDQWVMPPTEPGYQSMETIVGASANPSTPVVVLHGLGDSSTNPGMQWLCKSINATYPGTHVNCLNVHDGVSSITTSLDKQLEEFVAEVRKDEKLKDGFNAAGMSQGNLLIRAYIQRYNDPPVFTFVSMTGPNEGIDYCPDTWLMRIMCPAWKMSPYWEPIAMSDYWKNSANMEEYLEKSRFLADINNERSAKNQTYSDNMKSLEKLVLVKALNDTIVYPKITEWFGFTQWGETAGGKTWNFMETPGFKGDWIGLQTLYSSNRMELLSYEGEHLKFTSRFWLEQIVPFFAPPDTARTKTRRKWRKLEHWLSDIRTSLTEAFGVISE